MALSIVADSDSVSPIPGIVRSARWSCDAYSGSADALVAAGIITHKQLEPQNGRQPGVTVFLASGEPCPPHQNAWRDPGYKAIRQQTDGGYCVEVTVPKEVQAGRRKAEKEAKHESEQQRITEELAETGHQLRNWHFKQDFGGGAETWEGTKAQLQAAGLGVGMRFPGEPGGPCEYLRCLCPLGFAFRIGTHHNTAKQAAGLYIAHSWYVSRADQPKEFFAHAPGVLREVWRLDGWLKSDFYYGTAEALVSAGMVPHIGLFPGQPGRNKMQASYRKDWSPGNSSNSQYWGATIKRKGKKGQFTLEVPVTPEEEGSRKQQRKAAEEEKTRQVEMLSSERKKLRQGVEPEKSAEEFRAGRAEMAEFSLKLMWQSVFAKADGAISFDLPEGSQLRDDLAEAFETIRDAVQKADIVRDKKQISAVRARLKLVAARNDKGLQSVLADAKQLRLVHSTSGDGQG